MQLIPLQSKYALLLYQIHLLITWFKYIEFIINHTSKSCNKANKNELFSNNHKPNHSINNDYNAYANIGNHSNDNVEIYIANGAMSAAFRVAFNDTLKESLEKIKDDIKTEYVQGNHKDGTMGNIVFRALSKADLISIQRGRGISARNPWGNMSPEMHILIGSSRLEKYINLLNTTDPWISTTKSFDVANNFDSGNGVALIDLSKVKSYILSYKKIKN